MEARGLIKSTSSAASFAELATRPATLGVTLLACVIGATGAGAIAISMLLTIASATLVSSTRPEVQVRIAAERARRRAQRRREERETRLEEADVPRDGLAVLTRLADEIIAWDRDSIGDLDLEALLDRYADVELALARCRELRQATDAVWRRPRHGTMPLRGCPPSSSHGLCDVLEEELATIIDLFLALAEQIAARACEGVERELDATSVGR